MEGGYLLIFCIIAASIRLSLPSTVCQAPLGMEDKRIHDSQLHASSSAFSILTSAEMGRLNGKGGHGAWCPHQGSDWYRNRQGGPYYDQYFQIDLVDPVRISAIGTQGRSKNVGTEMVKHFMVNYTRPYQRAKIWLEYHALGQKSQKMFIGSGYNVSVVKINRLVPPIMAETIRIIPEIFPVNQVCTRLEIYGCYLKNDLVSYSMPPGNTRGPYNMTDFLFDGAISTNLLSSGLGQLTDSVLAMPDFRLNNGRGWIAWYIRSTPSPFVTFNFLKTQVFRSVTIHCNIRSRSDVELFEKVKVSFSEDGASYKKSLSHTTADVSSGYSWKNYNVTVDLCLHVAKAVRLEFAYRGEWIHISEVTFNNEPLGIKSQPKPSCLSGATSDTPLRVTTATPDPSQEIPTNGTAGGVPMKDKQDSLGAGIIAGIVCAVLLLILLLSVFLCFWYYRKRRRQNKKPSFYHFIRWELKPFNSNSARRVSRIPNEKDIDKGISLKRLGSHAREPVSHDVGDANGPIYASIHNLDEAGLLPTAPASNKDENEEGKPARSMSRGRSAKPKSKPPALPSEPVEGVPEVEYASPDSPLLGNNVTESLEGPDYAEPDSTSAEKNPLLSPSKKDPKSPTRARSPPSSPLPPRPDTRTTTEDNYEKPISPVHPVTGYSEPIDSLVFNEIFQNPVYEEIYSEPYQGVSGSTLYANPSTDLVRQNTFKEFPRDKLHFREKIGDGQFGEVHLGEAEGLAEILGDEFKNNKRVIVAIKMLKPGVDKNIKQDFFKEVKIMAGVRHENVVRLLGVCRDDPMCMIVEYMVNGDLNQFLKQRELAPGTKGDREKVVTYQALIYMALQLAAGMKYIASLKFVHRDLATRNCLVGHSYTVKIADFGMSRHLYSKHYYRIQGRVILPIRWMAPECILQGKFTTASDVWAFGVTLWEILTLAAEYPYGHLPDEKVIENVQLMFFRPESPAITYLEKPEICPQDVYERMMSCWTKEPDDRPDFENLYLFLKSRVRLSEMAI